MESQNTTRRGDTGSFIGYVLYWTALITIGGLPTLAGLLVFPHVPHWATTFVIVGGPALTFVSTFGALILLSGYEPRSLRQDHW